MNKCENKLKEEIIKRVLHGIYQHYSNLNIESKQEIEQAEIEEKNFNSKVDNKYNEENVLNLESKKSNNHNIYNHDDNRDIDCDEVKEESMKSEHKSQKEQTDRLYEIN